MALVSMAGLKIADVLLTEAEVTAEPIGAV